MVKDPKHRKNKMTTNTTTPPAVPTDQIQTAIEKFKAESQSIIVTNNEQRNEVIAAIQKVKAWKKRVKEYFAPSKTAAAAAHKAICANERGFTDQLDEIEKAARSAVLKFDTEQERIAKAEEARLRALAAAEAKKQREQLEAAAAKAKTTEQKEALQEAAATVTEKPTFTPPPIVRSGADTTKTTWKGKVVDLSIVPRMFLVVDQRAIDEFARSSKGQNKVPGIEFYESKSLSIR
jgi:septum formation inhibitor MinC